MVCCCCVFLCFMPQLKKYDGQLQLCKVTASRKAVEKRYKNKNIKCPKKENVASLTKAAPAVVTCSFREEQCCRSRTPSTVTSLVHSHSVPSTSLEHSYLHPQGSDLPVVSVVSASVTPSEIMLPRRGQQNNMTTIDIAVDGGTSGTTERRDSESNRAEGVKRSGGGAKTISIGSATDKSSHTSDINKYMAYDFLCDD